ncbi:MAG TPA: TssQ family T6SS-associated lipoprotein [Usitatibacteraceae bacterium]
MCLSADHRIHPDGEAEPAYASWRLLGSAVFALMVLAGCVLPPTTPAGPSSDEAARKQRFDRAQLNLGDGLKRYETGAYDEAIKNFLLALDSGVLTVPQQVTARKHMAFIHCLGGREAACKDEFQKVLALDSKFELPAAEAGHPAWGPVFKAVKNEGEARKPRFPLLLPALLAPSVADQRINEGMTAYDAADYNKTIKSFQEALKESLSDSEQIRVRKYLAFSYCLSNRGSLGRAEFEKILQLKPDFNLEPAEAGHPSWGPSFRAAKSKQKPNPAKK